MRQSVRSRGCRAPLFCVPHTADWLTEHAPRAQQTQARLMRRHDCDTFAASGIAVGGAEAQT